MNDQSSDRIIGWFYAFTEAITIPVDKLIRILKGESDSEEDDIDDLL